MRLIIFAFTASIAPIIRCEDDQLVFVQVVWRHGDRAPMSAYPTDPHQEVAWPNGWGELTERGMWQQYTLGKLLRERYINPPTPFLSTIYNAKEIYIRSTDVNRTLVSAQANLAGMFPHGRPGIDFPAGIGAWPSHWTPIPIHTVDWETDYIGNIFANCPRSQELYEEIQNSQPWREFVKQNQDFFEFLTKKTGMHIDATTINHLYDVFSCESLYNMTQLPWMNETVIKRLTNVTQETAKYLYGIGNPYVPELIKLRGGSLLKAIVVNMQQKIACFKEGGAKESCDWMKRLKYYAYSAHDTTVAALLTTFGDERKVIRGGLPKYTASVAIELWRRGNAGFAVKILFHSSFHDSYHPITRLTVGCPADSDFCPFATFFSRSKMFLPVNIEKECRAKERRTNRTKQIRSEEENGGQIAIYNNVRFKDVY